MNTLTILGIAGSLRQQSYNRMALKAAEEMRPQDTRLDIFDIRDIPLFNEDLLAAPPPAVTELKQLVRTADAILFATPEYNYSTSGVLKNAIDWGSRPKQDNVWNGKPVAIISASNGILGGVRAHYHLRQIFVTLNMHAVNQPEVMIAKAEEKFDAQGNLTDEAAKKLIRQLLENLVVITRRMESLKV